LLQWSKDPLTDCIPSSALQHRWANGSEDFRNMTIGSDGGDDLYGSLLMCRPSDGRVSGHHLCNFLRFIREMNALNKAGSAREFGVAKHSGYLCGFRYQIGRTGDSGDLRNRSFGIDIDGKNYIARKFSRRDEEGYQLGSSGRGSRVLRLGCGGLSGSNGRGDGYSEQQTDAWREHASHYRRLR